MPAQRRASVVPASLEGLRRRLTAWYVVTFLLILTVLGVGLFAAVTARFDDALDASLMKATAALSAVARERGNDRAATEIIVPDRVLFVTDSAGRGISGPPLPGWLARFAARAAETGPATISHSAEEQGNERVLRAHARPFRARNGERLVAIALADEIEVEDQYTSLILVGVTASLAAVVLVGIGGWIVARQSTAPVERAVAHMRRFMADAAHELRTPLTVIRSRAEVALQRPREGVEYVDALTAIGAESQRVSGIIEDLLMLARADAGQRPIERRRVFLDDIALDAAHAARALAERRGVALEVTDYEEAPVVGDPSLLRQLVMILLDNAIKFSRSGAGSVRLAVRHDASQAVVEVTDDGVGIAREHLPHVFERFYRGDAARQRVSDGDSEGVGLGLSIARWIADQHGATIRVESEYLHGARVAVSFPPAPSEALSSS